MRITKFTVLLLLITFAAFNSLNAQVKSTSKNWKSATFTIEINPSYVLPLQESKGNLGELFQFKNYGMKYGWGASFNFKFGLGPQAQYRPYLSLSFVQMQNKDDNFAHIKSNYLNSGYPYPSGTDTSVAGTSEMVIRFPSIAAGFEYAFMTVDKKKRKWYPHIGVEFLLSVIAGTYKQTSPNVTVDPNLQTSYIMKSDVRMGFGASLGATVRLGKSAGITFGGKYKLFNLFGKKSDFLKEVNKFNILDKANTSLNSSLSKDRNMGALEFYIGATIFLGKSKK